MGRSQARISNGKRLLSIGTLKPDVLLYSEPHPDDTEILEAVEDDLEICPDLVLVVGTKLEIPGALSIVTSFCYAARNRGGATVWISKEEPASRVRGLFDCILQGDCDAVAWSSVRIPRPSPVQMLTLYTSIPHPSFSNFQEVVQSLCPPRSH